MNYEPRGYEVQGRHLGWAKSAFETAGYPVQMVMPQPGGVYVIIINMPLGAPDLDFRSMPTKSRTWLRLPSARLMIWLAVAAIGAVGVWMLVNGGVKLPGMPVLAAPASVPTLPTLPDVGGIQRTVDGAVNAAKATLVAVLGMGALFVAYKFRGPLGQLGGMVGDLAKGLRHGR